MMLLLYFLFVVLPVVLWFSYFFAKDRCDPGPKKLMITIFVIGIGIAFFAGGIEVVVDRLIIGSTQNVGSIMSQLQALPIILSLFSVAVIEESLKYGALKTFFYEKVQFNQIADGIFYGVTLALGFSFVENTSYFIGLSRILPADQFVRTIILRSIFTVWLHITTGGLLGYYLGRRKFSADPTRKYRLSLLWAITLHAFFNAFGVFVSLILLVPTFAFLVYQFRKPEVTKVWSLLAPEIGEENP